MSEIRAHLPSLGDIRIKFFDVAEKVFNVYELMNEFDRQKKIKHLGLISELIESATHTRFEYGLLQCGIIQNLAALHKGTPDLSLGQLKIRGEDIYSSEILKSWALLSNIGHTRKTIGDERALLILCRENVNFRQFIIKPFENVFAIWVLTPTQY